MEAPRCREPHLSKRRWLLTSYLWKLLTWCPKCLPWVMWERVMCPNIHIILCTLLLIPNALCVCLLLGVTITAWTKRAKTSLQQHLRVSSIWIMLFFFFSPSSLTEASTEYHYRLPWAPFFPVPRPLNTTSTSGQPLTKHQGPLKIRYLHDLKIMSLYTLKPWDQPMFQGAS